MRDQLLAFGYQLAYCIYRKVYKTPWLNEAQMKEAQAVVEEFTRGWL